MKFYRIYIELTNICGLTCSFCPTKSLPTKVMTPVFFEKIIAQASSYTKEIACHVVGDPLTLSNLDVYLGIIEKYKMRTVLTTSGYYLNSQKYETLFLPVVKQINISLNSYNKNDLTRTFEEYMDDVLALCRYKMEEDKKQFINLRLWNLDDAVSERAFNQKLFLMLSAFFKVPIDEQEIYANKPKSIRLSAKILLHFDHYFEWPSLENTIYGDGTCQGLSSHIAILASGVVVPCCFDCDGVIELGNLHENRLSDILESHRAQEVINGFSQGKAVEELCQKCSYKQRFTS